MFTKFLSNYRYIAVEPRPESADVIKETFAELSHIKVPILITPHICDVSGVIVFTLCVCASVSLF